MSGLTDLVVGSTVPTGIKAPEIMRDAELGIEAEEVPIEPQAAIPQAPQNPMAQRFAKPTPTRIEPRTAAPVMQSAPQQPIAAAPAPAPAPQGGANPQQRQQLAAMFPNDPILGAAGGIGSLFS